MNLRMDGNIVFSSVRENALLHIRQWVSSRKLSTEITVSVGRNSNLLLLLTRNVITSFVSQTVLVDFYNNFSRFRVGK